MPRFGAPQSGEIALELIREHQIADAVRRIRRPREEIMVAVPYWGNEGAELVGLQKGQHVRIVCNLDSNGCNPYEVEKLVKLGAKVRSHPRLHAKIYVTNYGAIIGSSNASQFGIADDGARIVSSIEANVLTTSPCMIKAAIDTFEEAWASNEGFNVTPAALGLAKARWKARPRLAHPVTAKTLLAACREQPEQFENVFVAAYSQPLGPGGRDKLKSFRKQAKGGHLARAELGVGDFRRAWGYQYDEPLVPGSWLIDLDCRKGGRVYGCSRVPIPALALRVHDESDLTVTVPGVATSEETGRRFPISFDEKAALVAVRKALLETASGPVPISEALKIIDRQRAQSRKSEGGKNPSGSRREEYVKRVLNPIQRAKTETDRDGTWLKKIMARSDPRTQTFDPCSPTPLDFGVVSRLASLRFLAYSPDNDEFQITTQGAERAAQL